MKINNETKIGALTLIAVVLLLLGYNFLKGKNLFKSGTYLYVKYTDLKGLEPSNAVLVNGFQIGTIDQITAADKTLDQMIVEIKLDGDYKLPKNSIATIASNPLGSSKIEITKGNSGYFLAAGDTLQSGESEGILGMVSSKLGPAADQLTSSLSHLDSLLMNVNTVLNDQTKNSIAGILGNLQKTTASFAITSTYLQSLLNTQTGALAHSLNNMQSFTSNLASNNTTLTNSLANLESTTKHLSDADIQGMLSNLNKTVEQLQNSLAKLDSDKGTLGALINDRGLYDNMNNTMHSLNILMDDLRVHPKRYVNISVFGKKDKGDYLEKPLSDTAVKSK